MSIVLDAIGAAEGIGRGPVHLLNWGMPVVPHKVVAPDEVEQEVARFHEAREWARQRILEVQANTEERLVRVNWGLVGSSRLPIWVKLSSSINCR